jgi:crossover junction endodeoxyribonuclease RuvC
MVILAIDSGFERTGWAVIEMNKTGINYKTSGLIKTSAKKTMAKRLEEIYNELKTIIEKEKPSEMAIEQLFFFKNQKTVIPVAQAQGIAQLLAAQNDIELSLLTPLQIKQIVTGYGHSDKESVKKMIGLTLPKLDMSKMIDDEIDAIACGLAYCYLNKNLL